MGAPYFWKSQSPLYQSWWQKVLTNLGILSKDFEILSNHPKSFYNTASQAKVFLISVLDKPGFRADIPRFRPRNQCGSNSG